MKFSLRDYQQDGVEKLRESFRKGNRAPLFVLPTGGGKTAVFSAIAEGASARCKRVMILVHRQELLEQASRSLDIIGVPHGLISPRHPMISEPVQIASVQTLVRRFDRISEPDLIIIDEAHHANALTYRAITNKFSRSLILGVTATPCRTDSSGLGIDAGGIFDDLIIGPSIDKLIRMGFLVRPEVYAPPVGIDLTGIKRKMGDFDRQELSNRIDRPKIIGDTIEHYKKYCLYEPALAFCVSIAHAQHVASEFRNAGINATHIDGGMNDYQRSNSLKDLESGILHVITSADLIGEGVDIPRVSAAILLRPTHSQSLYLQQVGRALRPFPGKKRALVLDHVGNCVRHGLPDDDRQWSLDGGSVKSGKNLDLPIVRIEQCDKCYFVYERGPEKCPKCGSTSAQKKREIEVQKGELERITRDQILEAKLKSKREIGMARSLEDLKKIQRERGYKWGWAEKVYAGRRRG